MMLKPLTSNSYHTKYVWSICLYSFRLITLEMSDTNHSSKFTVFVHCCIYNKRKKILKQKRQSSNQSKHAHSSLVSISMFVQCSYAIHAYFVICLLKERSLYCLCWTIKEQKAKQAIVSKNSVSLVWSCVRREQSWFEDIRYTYLTHEMLMLTKTLWAE